MIEWILMDGAFEGLRFTVPTSQPVQNLSFETRLGVTKALYVYGAEVNGSVQAWEEI